ncbi:hypothetical protein [Caldalkalibacillus mannanilyticus]|uniref:hypothetical protein n=1 Tax=Caldalkalibacillus mannanilyticus TaxID=1418 RepID=UPI0005511130|nr:hypothetical protein [Caldalkalibacillus mannanilyticus]
MDKEQIINKLQAQGLNDIIELIEDAEAGYLEELELVESIGLLFDEELNQSVLHLLTELGVKLIYVTDDDEFEEEED